MPIVESFLSSQQALVRQELCEGFQCHYEFKIHLYLISVFFEFLWYPYIPWGRKIFEKRISSCDLIYLKCKTHLCAIEVKSITDGVRISFEVLIYFTYILPLYKTFLPHVGVWMFQIEVLNHY